MDYYFKLIMLGNTNVGKSNILLRFTKDEFSDQTNPTMGFEFSSKTVTIKDKKVKLQVWDTAGQERFRSLTKQYYKNTKGILLVFDLTEEKSFLGLDKWIEEVGKNVKHENIPVVLVGNKKDLEEEREVT